MRGFVAASKGHHMTIPVEKLKARLLANPKVKTEYDALAPEFEIGSQHPAPSPPFPETDL
jgi:hypothetical protein